ncbi:reverse transcriptase domain-containing protein, partial [Tanacetum coccineum]
MEELLRIPILGIEDAIVVPAVLADQFELKPELLDFIRAAETWLENEPPCSITTWDDLVSKFLNRFYPHSKTREFRKEITDFQQVFGETFTKAWERFKDLLRKCPHHIFSLLHQIEFFYNGLSKSDQDFLNIAAGGNLMTKNTQEALTIIENKAKVRSCRNKPQVSSSVGSSIQNDAITALTKQVEALVHHISSISQSTPLVPPPETPPLSTPKPKENLEPNPHQLLIQEENFQALENPTGRAGNFIYSMDIIDSLSNKVPIQNDKNSVSLTLSPDPIIESLSPSLTLFGDSDFLLEETDAFLALDSILPYIDDGSYDLEGDIL